MKGQDRDYNALARLANSSLALTADSQLSPLRTIQNDEVANFPRTVGNINRLRCK